jgi:hypothetical protein
VIFRNDLAGVIRYEQVRVKALASRSGAPRNQRIRSGIAEKSMARFMLLNGIRTARCERLLRQGLPGGPVDHCIEALKATST